MSPCAPPGLHLNFWYDAMNSHPGCEWLCTSRALFELFIWLYEIPYSGWVSVHLLGSIWSTNMLSWNPIQNVSGSAFARLHMKHWYAVMKFYLACEWLCTCWASFESLIWFHETPTSMWVAVHLLGFIWTTDMTYEIQSVSGCAPSGLHLNPSHASIKSYPESKLLCIPQGWFESLTYHFCLLFSLYMSSPTYSYCSTVNRPAISSQSTFKFLWRLNLMYNHISFFSVSFSYAFLIT